MEFIIISGLSGAGKSKVASFLEDIGFYVVDNMPAPLMPKFAELCMAGPGRYDRVALVTDIRGGQTFDGLFDALHELHRMGCAYKILFVEASVETIIKRYKETRRMHPLSSTSRSLDEAVRQERTVLAPVRQRAEYIIDTSALSTAKLRGEVLRLFGDGGSTPAMSVSVISFGFKYGIPIEADLVFDVRFLPNPYYIAELRHQTGLDEGVYSFVFGYQQTKDFMAHLGEPHRLPPAPVCGGGKGGAGHRHRLHRRAAPLGGHYQGPGRLHQAEGLSGHGEPPGHDAGVRRWTL